MSKNCLPFLMNKLYFSNLNLEITRKCNMACPHCMRGNAQNKNLNIQYAESLLSKTAFIGVLNFCGGEPTMNIEGIREILNLCKKYHVPVKSIGLITNGKKVTDEFLQLILDWYLYCTKFTSYGNFHGVYVSLDSYHEPIPQQNIDKLKIFDCVELNDYKENEDFTLFNLGRAKNLNVPKVENLKDRRLYSVKRDGNYYLLNYSFVLTCEGNILLDCDYCYDEIDKIIFCNIDNLHSYLEKFSKEININLLPFFSDETYWEAVEKNGIFEKWYAN